MAEQTKPTTPIKDAQAGIAGLKITTGEAPRIEFRVSFPLTPETELWMIYLARCCRFGSAYLDLRCPAPTLDEAAEDREAQTDPADAAPAQRSDLFPGWPIACGKPVRIEGANAICEAGHTTTTPFGEPCNHMERTAADQCAIVWNDDPDNRCELELGHPGAHKYPQPPLDRHPGITHQDPDEVDFP